jgi:hypothetical protein
MIKIKPQDLTGAALDWAVAKCEGDVSFGLTCEGTKRTALLCIENTWRKFSASQNWAQGGPIIEREFIELTTTNRSNEELWEAMFPGRGEDAVVQYGPTPLIAAMRCYVASKMGDEVDVPEEIAPCNT